MNCELTAYIRAQYELPPDQEIWEWAESNIDFSLVPNYDTPVHAPFDADYAPYMKQPLEWLKDHSTRELWIRKCSRAAATEYLLAWLRYKIAQDSEPTYYLTADQLTTERFMESRIKRGMGTCPPANEKYKAARVTEHDIRFPSMDFRVSWPNAKGAFKQDGWAAIIADEFPTWKAFAADMLRKRAGTYAFHKIVGLGSPDPVGRHPDGDPVILEYESTDQCVWMMKDPKSGNPFCFEFGGAKQAHGLKWPDDCRDAETGEWDLERVRKEAYYLTPDGTKIHNKERSRLVHEADKLRRDGDCRFGWVARNSKAPAHIHGIWIVGPMVPFADGDFGVLAYRFLEAKRRGLGALRAYFYENWADVGDMPNSAKVSDNSLRARELNYGRGGKFFEATEGDGELTIIVPDNAVKGLMLTVDVQKYHLWWVARWWLVNGENTQCGMEDWGNVANFHDLQAIIETGKPSGVGIDIGYAERYGEVADFCAFSGAIALKGEDNMKSDLYLRDDMNPNEGRKARQRESNRFTMLTWNTDIFRSKLLAAIRGETPWSWFVPKMAGRDYVRQVLSTQKIDGEWKTRKGYPDDHMFDCEVMQLVLARYDNLIH